MEKQKFVIADLSVLPPVYHKVLLAKEILESGSLLWRLFKFSTAHLI